jgi:hypothetical protein
MSTVVVGKHCIPRRCGIVVNVAAGADVAIVHGTAVWCRGAASHARLCALGSQGCSGLPSGAAAQCVWLLVAGCCALAALWRRLPHWLWGLFLWLQGGWQLLCPGGAMRGWRPVLHSAVLAGLCGALVTAVRAAACICALCARRIALRR